MELDSIFTSLDASTLFLTRAFVQVVIASAMAITTLHRGAHSAVAIWLSASVVNAIAWIFLPLGLRDASGDIASIQAALVTLALLLHVHALANLHDLALPWSGWPLLPVVILASGLGLNLDPWTCGTLMAGVVVLTLSVGGLWVKIHLRNYMRTSTYTALMSGTVLTIIGGTFRLWVGASDTIESYGHSLHLNALIAFFGSFVGLIVTQLAWLSLLKDRAEQKLESLAFSDSLTGLGNRRSLEEAWAKLSIHSSDELVATLIAVDLDHFKAINDRWGHEVGDQVLRKFAGNLTADLAGKGTAFRLGGEEFCIVLENVSIAEARNITDQLRLTLAASPSLPDGSAIYFSAGIASVSRAQPDLYETLSRADAALYRAKSNGRSRSEVEVLVAV